MTPRRRKICETEDEVAQVRADWQAEIKRGGSQHSLSADQRHDALQALTLLEKARAKEDLSSAVAYFIKHRYPKGGDLTMFELVNHFLASSTSLSKLGTRVV